MGNEVVENVPELRFPGFDGDWKSNRLRDIAKVVMGQSPSSNSYNYKKIGLPLIQGNADIKFRRTFPRCWTNEPSKLCYINDIILTVRAPVGSVAVSGHDACIGRGVCAIKNRSGNSNKFIFQWLLKHENKWVRIEQGSIFTAVSGKDIKTLKIMSCAIKEQKKIASFLTSIDSRITHLEEKKRLLTEYKKGVMQQIFSQQIRFTDDAGNPYPDWEEKRLGDVGDVIGGGTPETGNSAYWNGGINWFTPTEIKQKYVSNSMRTISTEGLKRSSAKMLPKGALLLSSRATVGYVSIALEVSATNQGFQSIIVNQDNSNEFIYYWILNNRKEFIRKASGSTFLEINKTEIQKLKIVLPQVEEQQKIADFLTAFDNKIEQVGAQLEQAKTFKKGLLQQMFV